MQAMSNKSLLLLALAAASALAIAASAPKEGASRDVLDVPAAKSPLAQRSLLNGLARAGDRVVAVGQRGHVLYTDDSGSTWQQAAVPLSSDLVAVHFASPDAGWAVGHDGVVLRTTDAGSTWSRQLDGRALGAVLVEFYERNAKQAAAADAGRAEALLAEAQRFAAQGAENPLLDVWFESETAGFVVGAFGLALKTNDGGATWEPLLHAIDNPKSLHLYAVRGVGADRYIAGEQGLLLKFDPTAQRFRAVELPYQGTLFGVTGNSRTLVVHGLRGTLLRSADGGRQWQAVDTGLQVGLTGSAVGADGRLYVVSQAGHVLSSRDDGVTFKPVAVDRPAPAAAVAATSSALVVAGPRGVRQLNLQ
jgi:photosystem II stability/assembly factor-like uncharacterized protein